MRKTIILLFLVLFAVNVFSAQTISDLNTNTPVPLATTLAITGNYNDSDSNSSVYCKFLILDSANRVIERLSDEKTFANGDFYAQRVLNEPLYKRGTDYNVSVDCVNANSSKAFTIGQRETIGHIAEEETKFVFERGNLDSMIFFGFIIFGLIVTFSVFIFWYRRAKGLWG